MKGKKPKQIKEQKEELLELDGEWKTAFGNCDRNGKSWLIFGPEKHGKTTFCLLLANYLARNEKVMYISAEQGTGYEYKEILIRLNITNQNLISYEYAPIQQISDFLKKRYAPRIVFIDNLTVYMDEFRVPDYDKLIKAHPKKLFIFVAHTDNKGEPYLQVGKTIRKLASKVVEIKGLMAYVGGRVNNTHGLIINEEKAMILHGSEIKE